VVADSAHLVVAGSTQLVVALVGNKWDSLHRVDKRNTMVLLTQSSTPVIVAT